MIINRKNLLILSLLSVIVSCTPAAFYDKGKSSLVKRDQNKINQSTPDHSVAYYYYTLGMLLEKKAKYNEAIINYQMAIDSDSSLLQAYARSAKLLLRTGKAAEAMVVANAALTVNSNFIDALNITAGVYSSRGDKINAIKTYRKLVDLNPKAKNTRLLLALAFYKAGKMGKAANTLDSLRKDFPKDILSHHYKGRVFIHEKKWNLAIKEFYDLVKAQPDFTPAQLNLGWLYEVKGSHKKALQVYNRLSKNNPLILHFVERVKKTIAASKEEKKKAGTLLAERPPEDMDINMRFALTYMQLADRTGNIENYNRSLEFLQLYRVHSPDDKQALFYVANVFERLGLFNLAVETWKELAKTDSTKARDMYWKIAEIYEKIGKTEEGLKYAIKAIELGPNEPEIHYFTGVLYNRVNKNYLAEKSLLRAVELKPADEKYFFYLGVVYEKLGKFDECISAMKKAIELKPDHANALNYLGYIYAEQDENLVEAEKYLLAALSLEPNNGYFIDSLGWIYYKQKKHSKALYWVLTAVRHIPPDPTVLEHLGDIYTSLNNPFEAVKAYEGSLKAAEPNGDKQKRNSILKKLNKVRKQSLQ